MQISNYSWLIEVHVDYGRRSSMLQFAVFDFASYDVMLGNDALYRLGVTLNFAEVNALYELNCRMSVDKRVDPFLLKDFSKIFSQGVNDMGRCKILKHKI